MSRTTPKPLGLRTAPKQSVTSDAGTAAEVRAGSPLLFDPDAYWMFVQLVNFPFDDLFSVHDPSTWSAV